MRRAKYDILKIKTNNVFLVWKSVRGIAPDSVSDKMDDAMLQWMSELTDTLGIWIEKGSTMTDGELILARTNMGALVESWLKFFYCVFYEDYIKQPKMVRQTIIQPNKMSFEDLKEFSVGKLWDDKNAFMYQWVDKIQHYRNSIHAFNYRDIGSPSDFINDIDTFYDFVESIYDRLPPVEDYMTSYPDGYVQNPNCI